MWDCLVVFSTWAESNSGQIQIVIAFGAIGLAFAAYQKALEQIKLTIKQGKIANKQREFELKINLLNSIEDYIGRASSLIQDIAILKIKYSKNLNVLDDPIMHDKAIDPLSNLSDSLNITLKKCQKMKEILHKYKRIPTSYTEEMLLDFSDIAGSIFKTEASIIRIKESLKENI